MTQTPESNEKFHPKPPTQWAGPREVDDDEDFTSISARRRRKKSRSSVWTCGCLALGAAGLGVVILMSVAGSALRQFAEATGGSTGMGLASGPLVGVLRVEGPIMSTRQALKQLQVLRRNPRLKALVVRVDSPGGAVGASEEIYREIRRFREETSTPIVISMGNAAASGGYYIATAGDTIFANSGTVTGSIGVIVQGLGVSPLFDKAGLESRTIKSGEMKDAGSPFRDMGTEDRAYFQGVVYDMYRQFFRRVLESRWKQIESAMARDPEALDRVVDSDRTKRPGAGLEWDAFTTGTLAKEAGATVETETALRRVADGRVLTGEQALAVGLVDQLGSFGDAAIEAARMAGLESGSWSIHDPEPRPDLSWLFNNAGNTAKTMIQEATRQEVSIEFR
jgi:protease-4